MSGGRTKSLIFCLLWLVWLALLQNAFGLALENKAAGLLSHVSKINCPSDIAYDGRNSATLVYNGRFLGGSGYDSSAMLIATSERNPTAEARDLFGKFADFLAAEETGAGRLTRDVGVNLTAPDAIPWDGRTVGMNANQNQMVLQDAADAEAQGATDIRINQQQVNAQGERVGINRPDLQYNDANGNRINVEYDTSSSTRGVGHNARIMANDPSATVILKTVD